MPIKGDVLRASDLAFRNGQIQSGLNADFIDGVSIEDLALSNHNHDTVYLKLIGGTMTGDLTLDKKSVIVTNPNNSSATLSMGWLSDSPRLKVGGSGTGSTGTFKIQNADDSDRMTLDSSGNAVFTGSVTAKDITVSKNGNFSSIIFPAQANDPGFIKHYENNNTSIMYFSVSDDADDTDYFSFGVTPGGTYSEKAKITGTGKGYFSELYEGGTPLSSKYIPLSGGTMTNTLNGTNINMTQESHFSLGTFSDPHPNQAYAIKASPGGIATDRLYVNGPITALQSINVAVGNGIASLRGGGLNVLQLSSYFNYTWFRNEAGCWTFQSGTGADDWTQSFQLFQPLAGSTPNAVWFEIGQRHTNDSTNGGRYRGVRIVKHIGTGGVVDGDLKLGKAFFGNFSIEYNSAQDSLDFVYNG